MGQKAIAARWVWPLLIAALPAAIPPILISRYAVNLPLVDQWQPDIAGLFVRSHEHALGLHDFLAQHNEHRILIPRLIFFLLGLATHWNTIAEMICSWLAACASSVGILWLILRTTPGTDDGGSIWRRFDVRTAFLWLLCNLLMFNPAQWENWLGGMGLANVMPMAFIIAGLVALYSRFGQWTRAGLAMLFATAATFSCGSGFQAWPLLGAVLAWSPSLSELIRKRWVILVWCGAGVVNVGMYLWGYEKAPADAAANAYFAGFGKLIAYVVVFLGNLFGFVSKLEPVTSAAIAGTIMLVLFLLAAGYFVARWLRSADEQREQFCRRMLVWLAVGGYALMSAVTAAMLRAGLGMAQAGSSRYVSFSLYLPLALVNLLPVICADFQRRGRESTGAAKPQPSASLWERLPAATAGVLMVMLLMIIAPGFNGARISWFYRRNAKAALLLINVLPETPPLAATVLPDTKALARHANALSQLGYLNPPLINSNSAKSIELPPNQRSHPVGRIEHYTHEGPDQLLLAGWAMHSREIRPSDAVFLTCQDERGEPIIIAFAEMPTERPDLAKQNKNEAYHYSGWRAQITSQLLPPATGPIKIAAWTLDAQTGQASKLENEFTLRMQKADP